MRRRDWRSVGEYGCIRGSKQWTITASVRVGSNSPGFGYRYDIRRRNVRYARTLPTCLGEMEKAMTALLANADAVDLLPELVPKKDQLPPIIFF